MNKEFTEWLSKQTYDLGSFGWPVLEIPYDDLFYWCWDEIIL